ncbi:MAG: antibiotic biosynthesis monooxygenase family protein [Acidimicrobiia bacterium]
MITVVAHYKALQGRADEVAAALIPYAEIVRTEPGCVTFDVNRSLEDDHDFVLYEVYRDQAAFDAHVASEHFTSIAMGRIRPMLADRQVSRLTPI